MVMLTSVLKVGVQQVELQFDNKADIPSESAGSFVEFQEGDKTVFMHKDLAESKKTAYRFQGQMTNLQKDFDGFKGKITQDQATAAETARKEQEAAIAAKILELKGGEDNHSEVHKLEMQQAEDKYNSLAETHTKLESDFTGLQTTLVEKENRNLAVNIASQYVPSDIVESFSKLLMMSHIKSVEGKSVFTNASGEAVDNDIARIVEVLNKDPQLKHFAKFPGSKGGFGGKGGSSETDGKVISRKDYEAKTPAEKANLMEKGVTLID